MKKSKFITFFFVATLSIATTAQIPSYIPTDSLVGWWPFNGNANDESGNGNHGTVNGATLVTDRNGNTNKAYRFNVNNWTWGAGGDMIYIPYNSAFNSNLLTVSAWFKRTSGGLSWNAQDLSIVKRFQYGYSSPNGETFQIGVDNRNGANPNKLYVHLIEQGSSGRQKVVSFISNDSVSLNQWNNVTYTLSNNNFRVYLNGKLLSSQFLPTGFKINTQGNSGLSIGMSEQANGHWGPYDGLIDDVGFWNRALDSNEIKALCVVSKSASIHDLTQGLKALLSKKSYCCAVCSALKKSNTMTSDIIPPVLFTDSEEYVIKAQLEGKSTIELSNESKKSKFTIRNQRMSLMEKNQCTMEEIVRRYLFWHTKG